MDYYSSSRELDDRRLVFAAKVIVERPTLIVARIECPEYPNDSMDFSWSQIHEVRFADLYATSTHLINTPDQAELNARYHIAEMFWEEEICHRFDWFKIPFIRGSTAKHIKHAAQQIAKSYLKSGFLPPGLDMEIRQRLSEPILRCNWDSTRERLLWLTPAERKRLGPPDKN